MPKKGREKDNVQTPRQKKPDTANMPQVWLPDQPGPEGSEGYPCLPSSPQDSGPPTDEEQKRMAQLWAEEEQLAPRGWDEDQELDYSEAVRRREEREMSEPRESGDNEVTPDLFKYSRPTSFPVRSLGHISPLTPSPSSQQAPPPPSSEGQTALLSIIDKAQKRGLLPWVTSESDERLLSISKYGAKEMDVRKQRIFARHALHYIINITYYEDTYGKHMLAVKVATATDKHRHELYIYEAKDEDQAKEICVTLGQAFEAVHSNLRLQQNLTSDPR